VVAAVRRTVAFLREAVKGTRGVPGAYVAKVPETQREPVPRNDAGELDTATAFLTFARSCVIKKTEGLSEQQLRQVVADTGTSLLGLVWHLIDGERYWFGYHLAGRGVDDYEFGMAVPAEISSDDVLLRYREAIAASDAILDELTDLDQPMAIPTAERRHTARWVVAHMTSETARHAGHADILRELIDGTTGR
jgi:uncharacterized damage-inducible protein DinB